jgi:hypothetical protein
MVLRQFDSNIIAFTLKVTFPRTYDLPHWVGFRGWIALIAGRRILGFAAI